MGKETVVQPAKSEVKASESPALVAGKSELVIAEIAVPESNKQVETSATVEKVMSKPKAAKEVVAEKLVTTPKTPAKPDKKIPTVAKKKVVEAPTEKVSRAKKQAPKKPKLVRDSFTIPEADYALFATLKQRALTAGIDVKKSEILRAAMITLANLNNAGFAKAIGLVERIKTGRPKK